MSTWAWVVLAIVSGLVVANGLIVVLALMIAARAADVANDLTAAWHEEHERKVDPTGWVE